MGGIDALVMIGHSSRAVVRHPGRVERNPGPLRVAPWVKFILRSHLLQPALLRVVGAGIVPEHIAIPGVRRSNAGSLARRVGVAVGATVGAAAVAWWALRRRHREV